MVPWERSDKQKLSDFFDLFGRSRTIYGVFLLKPQLEIRRVILFLWEKRRLSIPDKTERYMPIFEKDFKRIYRFFFCFFFYFSVIPNRFKGDKSYTGVFFCRIRIEGQTNNTNNKHSKPFDFNLYFAFVNKIDPLIERDIYLCEVIT